MLNQIKEMHDGHLDILFLNAGGTFQAGKQLEMTEETFDKYINLNLKANFFLVKECREILIKAALMSTEGDPRSPCILANSSVLGRNPLHLAGMYSATKSALDTMMKFLSVELMEDGVRVNVIAPGIIDTPMASVLDRKDFHPKLFGEPS